MPFRSFQLTQLVLFTISYCNLISLLYLIIVITAQQNLFYFAWVETGQIECVAFLTLDTQRLWGLGTCPTLLGNYPDQGSNAHRFPHSSRERALWKQTSNLAYTNGRINYISETIIKSF